MNDLDPPICSNTTSGAVTTTNQYANRNSEALGQFYMTHVDAMTVEGLHRKSDIAAELAYRDCEIAKLRKALLIYLTPQHEAKGN